MSQVDSSRRGFLKLGGTAISGSWLATHWPALLVVGQTACVARDKKTAFTHLTGPVATDLAAIAAQIIPTDETPGAEQAGVIYFIDGALDTVMKGAQGFLESGLESLNTQVAKQHGDLRFAELDSQQQMEVLRAEEQSPFFSAMRFLTIAGMFAMPSHGGNQNKIGWELLGFDSRHGWQAPFGYYDAEEFGIE